MSCSDCIYAKSVIVAVFDDMDDTVEEVFCELEGDLILNAEQGCRDHYILGHKLRW